MIILCKLLSSILAFFHILIHDKTHYSIPDHFLLKLPRTLKRKNEKGKRRKASGWWSAQFYFGSIEPTFTKNGSVDELGNELMFHVSFSCQLSVIVGGQISEPWGLRV